MLPPPRRSYRSWQVITSFGDNTIQNSKPCSIKSEWCHSSQKEIKISPDSRAKFWSVVKKEDHIDSLYIMLLDHACMSLDSDAWLLSVLFSARRSPLLFHMREIGGMPWAVFSSKTEVNSWRTVYSCQNEAEQPSTSRTQSHELCYAASAGVTPTDILHKLLLQVNMLTSRHY